MECRSATAYRAAIQKTADTVGKACADEVFVYFSDRDNKLKVLFL